MFVCVLSRAPKVLILFILLPAQKRNSLRIYFEHRTVGTVYVLNRSCLRVEKGLFSRYTRSNYREREEVFPVFPPNKLFFPSLALRATQGQKPKHCSAGEWDLALTLNGIGFGQGAKSSRSDGNIVQSGTA